ncbi:MAG: ISL3 family transposase [Actinomycetota bacterium]|nr:ISL3 family transposase [Actinomycetota bacterium]
MLDVVRLFDRLLVTVESTDRLMGCEACGTRASIKDRDRVDLADLPAFGSPVTLVWLKRRWRCGDPDCEVGTWTEDHPDIAPARATMTRRAGVWATTQVGRHVHSVSWAARELGVAWHTVMDAVTLWGTALVEHPDPVGATKAIGVDETSFLAATASESTRWVSSICDVEGRRVIDLIEGRGASDLDRWLTKQSEEWKEAVKVTVSDLHEPFRAALKAHLPDASAVADPFHVVAVGTRCVDATRRRVQNETLGHRGRKGDPLYRCRKLLAMAEERLDEATTTKLRGLLAAGDPEGHVGEARMARDCLRDLYTLYGNAELAGRWIDGIIDDCVEAEAKEVRGMARTLKCWRSQILAWHTTGATNGPTEGLNSIIKKVKRVGAGFRSFANYRLRILLAVGGCNWSLLDFAPR